MKTIFVGETAHLYCGDVETLKSPVDWLYKRTMLIKDRQIQIVSRGKLINGYVGRRLGIRGSTLIINNATRNDSGIYTCVENSGIRREHNVVLHVQGYFRD